MKCPKCGYTSFDHLPDCKKCGIDLGAHKERFGLTSLLLGGRVAASAAGAAIPTPQLTTPSWAPEPAESGLDFATAPDPGESSLGHLLGETEAEVPAITGENFEPAATDDLFSLAAGDNTGTDPLAETAGLPTGVAPALPTESDDLDQFLDLDLDLAYEEAAPVAASANNAGDLDLADYPSMDELPTLEEEPAFSFDSGPLPDLEEFPLEVGEEFSFDGAAPAEEATPLSPPRRQSVKEGPSDPFEFRESAAAGRAPVIGRPTIAAEATSVGQEAEPLDGGMLGDLPPLTASGLPSTWGANLPLALDGEFPAPEERLATPEPGEEPSVAVDATEAPEERVSKPPLLPRCAAGLTDFVILGIIFVCFVLAADLAIGGTRSLAASFLDLLVPYFLVFFCLCFGYFTLFHFLVGQTLGKMLFQLRVVGIDQEPLLFSQAFLRSTGGLLSMLTAGLGFVVIFFDPRGRGWNDRLAGTRVVIL